MTNQKLKVKIGLSELSTIVLNYTITLSEETYKTLNESFLTTWPCLTEAMYFLSELRGWSAQTILWELINRKVLDLYAINQAEYQRMEVLMEKYQDLPMDLADASLVAVAESQKIKRIFTLDSDFYVYRLYDKDAFEVIP
ncbi:MAG: PIN domain-containing protein [Roseofilum sp. SBFL]|uniref:type II toxin-antitoxin system VapC family toxin n=1 Tax=unclassified Roseofilum TaxID=2620099 RepID=UPI001B1D2F52|nr:MULTISPECIES: PIN domain-containing protein [unclassified Roseofilum]MBP0013619.1 PIN domain-containing protein [Roseofilum sp. SID3]MBP0026731.1 PIN domain-containing protein [Roseofilum sp. SID2]MBP0039331.1 PIN domain-containing protein [Roseofilum sp. SID1]MBP0041221.1 PIN domain-containing protein [Roseofilum sp. SBFL]